MKSKFFEVVFLVMISSISAMKMLVKFNSVSARRLSAPLAMSASQGTGLPIDMQGKVVFIGGVADSSG